jgi:tripartite-type tricarboxylate transporter receptor subunit TctC
MKNMNITSAQYVAYGGSNVCIKATIDGVEMSVPLDTANRHYAEIMRQVEAGTLTIQDAD